LRAGASDEEVRKFSSTLSNAKPERMSFGKTISRGGVLIAIGG